MSVDFYEVAAVKLAARDRWIDVLARFGVDTSLLDNRHGPCPGCGGKDRFRFDDQDGNGTFLCSQGGGELLAGDGLALLMHIKGWEWARALAEVANSLGVRPKDRGAEDEHDHEHEHEWGSGVVAEPHAARKRVPEADLAKIEEFTRGCPEVSNEWFKERSPVDVEEVGGAADFLGRLYEPGERVLIFLSQWSQGDFLFCRRGAATDAPQRPGFQTSNAERPTSNVEVGGSYRLSQERGVKAKRSELPRGGKEGVWFLVQPVTGLWAVNQQSFSRFKSPDDAAGEKPAQWSRRFHGVVTAWRYFVLESDDLPHELWRKVVACLQLPIAAIYTSGGRSIHALVRQEVSCKAEWDAVRDALRQIVCPLGADAGALSAVRLSRLPFCERGGTRDKEGRYVRFAKPGLQELLYLNPDPDHRAIRLLPALTEVAA